MLIIAKCGFVLQSFARFFIMPRYITAREIRERFQVAFETHQADALTEVLTALETERVAELAEIREGLATLVGVTTRLAQA
ncbi:MAG: hypothetical protein DCC52_04945, partial [Chloroflexi bacterium]